MPSTSGHASRKALMSKECEIVKKKVSVVRRAFVIEIWCTFCMLTLLKLTDWHWQLSSINKMLGCNAILSQVVGWWSHSYHHYSSWKARKTMINNDQKRRTVLGMLYFNLWYTWQLAVSSGKPWTKPRWIYCHSVRLTDSCQPSVKLWKLCNFRLN